MKPLRGAKAYVSYPAYDTTGKKDSSGAFRPEAMRLIKALGLRATANLYDNNRVMTDRRREVSQQLEKCSDLDLVAFLCHGWKDGIQAGWRILQVDDLAKRLTAACKPDAVIVLYCCDTGKGADVGAPGGKGGFASALWMELERMGFRGTLWAHSTAGHTTQNPHVKIWRVDEEPELGVEACERLSPLWGAWARALRLTEFRYRMLQCQTEEELQSAIEGLATPA